MTNLAASGRAVRIEITVAKQWVANRRQPILMLALLLAATLLYTYLWGPVVRHHSYWITPGDLWGTFRTAQYVGWGDIGDVYNAGAALVTLPLISVLLAPVAMLAGHLGMSISYPFPLAHPSAWYLLGPAEVVLGGVVLFPLNALAKRLGVEGRARTLVLLAETVLLWPVIAWWGHPEDPLAIAFWLWALLAVLDRRWRAAGWLFGLGLAAQPLVVLVIPILFAVMPSRQWIKTAVRGVLPSLLLLSIPLAQAWHQTTAALIKQPNYPTVDHPTPWLSLAPALSKTHPGIVTRFGRTSYGNASRFTATVAHTILGETVAAGPGRLIAIVLCVGLAVFVYRRRPGLASLVWLCCVALALRCVFEAVMDPYYLWPPLAIAVLLVVRSPRRLLIAAASASAMTWWSYQFVGPWAWWAPVVGLLGIVVLAASPLDFKSLRTHAQMLDPSVSP